VTVAARPGRRDDERGAEADAVGAIALSGQRRRRAGQEAAATPPTSPPAVLVPVRVTVVVMVMGPRPAPPAREDARPDGDDEHARGERQPRIQALRDDEAGEQERDEPEDEDAGGVRRGDDQAEENGVSGLPRVPTR
jgi:hypothetical protein